MRVNQSVMLFALAVLVTGCMGPIVPRGAPTTTLNLSSWDYGGGANSIWGQVDCSVTIGFRPRALAIFNFMAKSPKDIQVPVGMPIRLNNKSTFTTGMGPGMSGTGTTVYGQSCSDGDIEFVPEAGHTYRAEIRQCRTTLIDVATNLPPPSAKRRAPGLECDNDPPKKTG
jgi:hypothetical protein